MKNYDYKNMMKMFRVERMSDYHAGSFVSLLYLYYLFYTVYIDMVQ